MWRRASHFRKSGFAQLLIDFGAIARQGAFPIEDAHEGKHQRVGTRVRSSSTLVHKSTGPSRTTSRASMPSSWANHLPT